MAIIWDHNLELIIYGEFISGCDNYLELAELGKE
jgi:hypothetical protein